MNVAVTPKRKLRIAFLTPQYVSDHPGVGGLGNYLYRTCQLLLADGHEPEVFLSSLGPSASFMHDGVRVHRVNWRAGRRPLQILYGVAYRTLRFHWLRSGSRWSLDALGLAGELERRHKEAPFDLVQSASFLAAGLFVRRMPGRPHVVRFSSAVDLYSPYDKPGAWSAAVRDNLERLSMRRADIAYAPSQLLVDHFRDRYGYSVRLMRPPVHIEQEPAPDVSFALPDRYLHHFGMLVERKGTDLLARALNIAWQKTPDLTMVWSGRYFDEALIERWRASWGEKASQVIFTGPLKKPELYAVLQRTEAAVLPSQIDNLPNTVIESLMFGIPVLGSRGASIDELVEENVSGHLVPLGDVNALADALVRFWRRDTPVRKGFVWRSPVAEEMEPSRAIANLVALADSGANAAR